METILETSTAGCVENAIARVGPRSRISKSCRGAHCAPAFPYVKAGRETPLPCFYSRSEGKDQLLEPALIH